MAFWTFVLFYLTIYVLPLLHILFCLICWNLLILKNGLIKKINLRCSRQVFVLLDLRFIESSYMVSICIHLSGNNWLEKSMWTWKRYQFIVGATLISKMKKVRWRKEYLSSVNCSFAEMSKNTQIRKRQWSVPFDTFDFVLSQKYILISTMREHWICSFVRNGREGVQIKCTRQEIIKIS